MMNTSSCVPPRAPRSMPVQDLSARGQRRRFQKNPPGTLLARLITFGGASAVTIYATWQMYLVVFGDQLSVSEGVFVVLFGITFGWIALSACAALAGALISAMEKIRSLFTGRRTHSHADSSNNPKRGSQALQQPECEKVAIVMPIHNENPAEYCAALQTMANDLADAGQADQFEIFILSDTTQASVWLSETAAIAHLRSQLKSVMPVWYRRRRFNTARKAGNIRGFVENWGTRYTSMIVLDADSLMRADTILALVDAMQSDESAGIIQSVPALVGGKSLYARLQQFAGSVYGPIVAKGVSCWQGRDGNYWGHNAIIRLQAFAEASGLPTLPGRRPLGGEIMSHDFVEAALVRKAGWGVTMLPSLSGSWEDSPPSLLDVAVRDRRWAQGNIQHLAVIGSRGLSWSNRAHFLIGVMSYVSSALWLALISAGLVLSVQSVLIKHEYFTSHPSLFPNWPTFDSERMLWVFLLSMLVLFLPKILGTMRVLVSKTRRNEHGGGVAFIGSVVLEIILSTLYAPILMLMQVRQLWQIALGQDSGWALQSRNSDTMPWHVVWQRHWMHVTTGVSLAIGLSLLLPSVLPWMIPVIIGLVGAAALSRWSADVHLGRRLADAKLLLIPEERHTPVQLQRRDTLKSNYQAIDTDITVRQLLMDAALAERHFSMVIASGHLHKQPGEASNEAQGGQLNKPDRLRGQPDKTLLTLVAKLNDAESVDELLQWLDQDETLLLLNDPAVFKHASSLANRAVSREPVFTQGEIGLEAIA